MRGVHQANAAGGALGGLARNVNSSTSQASRRAVLALRSSRVAAASASCRYAAREWSEAHPAAKRIFETAMPCSRRKVAPPARSDPGVRFTFSSPRKQRAVLSMPTQVLRVAGQIGCSGSMSLHHHSSHRTHTGSLTSLTWTRPMKARFLGSSTVKTARF